MSEPEKYFHKRLSCGVEMAVLPLSGRRTVAFEIRVLAGMAHEPAERLGLAGLVEETLAKGTAKRDAQGLSNAFDMIGAAHGAGVGRESMTFRCSCLPEYLGQALELHAEMLRTPTFPADYCRIAIDLAKQELTSLEDDPGELARKAIGPFAYGGVLGRHELGNRETLERITRDDIVAYWRSHFAASRIQVSIGGAVDPAQAEHLVDHLFEGFGANAGDGRGGFGVEFSPSVHHQTKELEQQHILICYPGVSMTHKDYPVEQLMISILGDGMSSRLFTEVREKQGLVYWVGAWDEHPRNAGMIFLGASTTPARCDQTFRTLMREVDRLAEDLTEDELRRAKMGIITKSKTHGDITRARLSDLSSDLFYHGRPIQQEEKDRQISAVTIADIQRYLRENRRDRLCVMTLGPKAMDGVRA